MLLLIILSITLTACQARKEHKIGVALYHCYSWREKVANELQLASYKYDNVMLDIQSANNDPQLQVQQIRKMVDNGAQLLIISPITTTEVAMEIERQYNNGIPIILLDNKSLTNKYTAYLGADNTQIGESIAHYVGSMLKDGGNIVEIQGKKEDVPTQERHHGFVESLETYSNVNLLCSEYGDWIDTTAEQVLDRILNQYQDIDVIFFHSDGMINYHMVEKARKANPNIRFIGIDALSQNPSGIDQIRRHRLTASFIYPTRGDKVLDLAMNILQDKKYEREEILPTGVVDAANIESILQQHIEIDQLDSQIKQMQNSLSRFRTQYSQQRLISLLVFVILIVLLAFCIIVAKALRRNSRLRQQLREHLAEREKQAKLLTQSNEKLQQLNSQIEQEAELKINFFTNVSHEIRTPLTLIAGPVEQLRHNPNLPVKKREELLEVTDRNVHLMLDMVNDILDYRKVQNGAMALQPTHFDLAEALNLWTENFRVMAQNNHVSLRLEGCQTPLWVHADKKKLTSITVNLISNALKYTSAGDTITLTLSKEEHNLNLSVSDTGQGIDATDLPHIFDTFYQSAQANSGTGIGLALTKSLVQLHGGSITAQSRPGEGTTILVSLPLEIISTDIIAGTDASTSTIDDSCTLPTVLVIDDNAEMRSYVHLILDSSYHVIEATNGLEGYEQALISMPDIIVCDVMMPVMDGIECCSKLKTTVATSHIPVILLTARSLDEHYIQAFQNGADAYITKPFTASVLQARIANLLNSRAVLRHLFSAESDNGIDTLRPRESEFVNRFKEYVNQHLSDSDLSIEGISQAMNLSRAQFYAKIKTLTGISPIDHLRKARLQKACHLLLTTDMTVAEIAYHTGFTAPSYFSKCFREQYRVSPQEWRKEQMKP